MPRSAGVPPRRRAPRLYGYQRRWLTDRSRFKIGLWSRQVGKTFTATMEIVDDVLRARADGRASSWLILSRGDRQARAAMRAGIQAHARAWGLALDRPGSGRRAAAGSFSAHEWDAGGGSVVTALPANPDTARGYSRHVYLDEFALHRDSREIWGALYPSITRGHRIRVTSTPKGRRGKFHDLMSAGARWSRHFVTIHDAVAAGYPVDPDELRAGLADDELWRQEYECAWLDEASAWLAFEAIGRAEDPAAGNPARFAGGPAFIGVDVARRGDLWVAWALELVDGVAWTREIRTLRNAPFAAQETALGEMVARYRPVRVAMDRTGIGEMPVERAQGRHGRGAGRRGGLHRRAQARPRHVVARALREPHHPHPARSRAARRPARGAQDRRRHRRSAARGRRRVRRPCRPFLGRRAGLCGVPRPPPARGRRQRRRGARHPRRLRPALGRRLRAEGGGMIRERLIRLLGGAPGSAPGARGRMREAAGAGIAPDAAGWRALGGERGDLPPRSQARMQELAVSLWETNLLAHRLIELPIAWLLGDGLRLAVPDPEAQGWLDAFWRDPVTDMRRNLPRMMRELALFGEQCWPVFADPASGHVRLGYLDPRRIATVVADPDNAAQPVGVVTARDRRGRAWRYRVTVAGPETVFGAAARRVRETMTDGDAFLFQRNRLMCATRGRSDLLAAIDWLGDYERFLRGEMDRADFLRAFVWDVRLDGAQPEEVARRAAEIAAPAPGTVRVHNESETWSAITPGLSSDDVDTSARLLRNHVLSGLGWPEHWFGGGGDVNRATAAEMGDPAFKALAARQREWSAILEEVAACVIRRRRDPSGRTPPRPDPGPDLAPTVEWPEMVTRDESRHADALARVTGAVVPALDRGLMSELTALRLIRAVAERLGVAFDAEAELAAARAEAAARTEAVAPAGAPPPGA